MIDTELAVVSLKDVKAAIRAYTDSTFTRKAQESAYETCKAAAMKVWEALLGVKTEAEVQAMSPEEIKKLARSRIRKGLVKLDGIDADILLDRVIQKSQSRRNVPWKEMFVLRLGETAATDVLAEAAESFSYKFADAL